MNRKKNRGRKMVSSEWPESDEEKGDAVIEVQSCHLCLIASYAFPHSFVSLSICLSARPSARLIERISLHSFAPRPFSVTAGTIANGRRTFRSLHSLQSLLSFALLEYICPLLPSPSSVHRPLYRLLLFRISSSVHTIVNAVLSLFFLFF